MGEFEVNKSREDKNKKLIWKKIISKVRKYKMRLIEKIKEGI